MHYYVVATNHSILKNDFPRKVYMGVGGMEKGRYPIFFLDLKKLFIYLK